MSSGRIVWIAAVAVALITRTVGLDRWPGLNGDEAWYGVNIQEFLAGGTPFLRTPPGNLLSPVHSGLLLVLSWMFDTSPALLRLPEVILGMTAVLLAYPLLRKPLGERTALLATVLLAVSPTAIAYARVGWDPSGTPLLILLAMAAALHDRPVGAVAAMAVACMVHPTNVFAFPIVATAWLPHGIGRYQAASNETRRRWWLVSIAGALLVVPAGVWVLIAIADNPATPLPSVAMVIERLVSPGLWIERATGAFHLLSGVSSVTDIAAPMTTAGSAATGAVGFIIAGTILFAASGWRQRPQAVYVFAGMALAFAGFHIVAIPFAFHPGYERYALFLLTPMLICGAIGLDAAIARTAAIGTTAAIAVTATMLMVIGGGYFYPFSTAGGASAMTYRTGMVEPKLAALRFIEADSRDLPAVTVLAGDWWLYWSLRYFAGPNGRIHIEPAPSAPILGGTHPPQALPRPAPASARTYLVTFAQTGAAAARSNARFAATDPQGQPIVEVLLLAEERRP